MAYREHGMWEILDVLKRHHRGESQRRIAAATGRGRKTIRAYIPEVPISTNEGFDYKHLYFIALHDFQVASF